MDGSNDSGERPIRREPVDTRDSSGPDGRTYTASFAAVWDAVAAEVDARRGWSIVHSDEDRGLFTVSCRSRLRRSATDLSIWVRLDDYGLTRLDVRSDHREGRLDAMAARKQVRDLLAAIDGSLGPGTRIKG